MGVYFGTKPIFPIARNFNRLPFSPPLVALSVPQNKRRMTNDYRVMESKGNWWVRSSTTLLPWFNQTLTIGMVPINLRQCLRDSSLLSRTSNSRSELGRSSTFGSDRMAGQYWITSFCSELGRHSLGTERMAGQESISNSCSELGRPSLGSDRMAAQL